MHGEWHDGMGNGGWWWIPMMIMMIAFWGGLIWIGVTLLKRNHTAPAHTPNPPISAARPTAEEILAERLARGEIEPDDYRQRLDALRTPPSN